MENDGKKVLRFLGPGNTEPVMLESKQEIDLLMQRLRDALDASAGRIRSASAIGCIEILKAELLEGELKKQ